MTRPGSRRKGFPTEVARPDALCREPFPPLSASQDRCEAAHDGGGPFSRTSTAPPPLVSRDHVKTSRRGTFAPAPQAAIASPVPAAPTAAPGRCAPPRGVPALTRHTTPPTKRRLRTTRSFADTYLWEAPPARRTTFVRPRSVGSAQPGASPTAPLRGAPAHAGRSSADTASAPRNPTFARCARATGPSQAPGRRSRRRPSVRSTDRSRAGHRALPEPAPKGALRLRANAGRRRPAFDPRGGDASGGVLPVREGRKGRMVSSKTTP
jgi:hypothetical protein